MIVFVAVTLVTTVATSVIAAYHVTHMAIILTMMMTNDDDPDVLQVYLHRKHGAGNQGRDTNTFGFRVEGPGTRSFKALGCGVSGCGHQNHKAFERS